MVTDGSSPADISPSLAAVLDTVLDAVIVMAADGRIVAWNDCAQEVFGWSAAEAVGRMLGDLIGPERHKAAHKAGLARVMAGSAPRVIGRRIEITALRQDGAEFPVELSIISSQAGTEPLFVGFLRDISERRAAEHKLRQQELQTRLLYEVAQMAAEADSLEAALERTLEAICELSGWPAGHAFLVAESNPNKLNSTAIWIEREPGCCDAIRGVTDQTEFGLGIGLPGMVLERSAALWVCDMTQGNFPRRGLGFRGAFGFPVKCDGQVIAVLEFFSRQPAEPDDELLLSVQTLGEQVGRVLERKRTQDRQDLLVQELNHRVKNTLAIVQGIAQQTFAAVPGIEPQLKAFVGRLHALARANDLIVSQDWHDVTLRQAIETSLAAFGSVHERTTLDGEDVMIGPRLATSVGLAVHELCTNAIKYGSLSIPAGTVDIRWSTVEDAGRLRFVVEWKELGGPPVSAPKRKGFGTTLLERVLARDLGGKIDLQYRPEGLVCRFETGITKEGEQIRI